MTTKMKLGFAAGLLATALLAACGGGGGTSTTLPAKSAGNTGSGSGAQATTTGPHLSFTFTRSTKPTKSRLSATGRRTAGSLRGSAATRSPKYFSNDLAGFQITVTSGSATQTLYVDANSPNVCVAGSGTDANNVYTCNIAVPTLGSTESIAALEVDQEPVGGSTTGYGTAFPSNSVVLAVGNTTATLSAGQNTVIPLSFNPVMAYLADCGSYTPTYNQNMAVREAYSNHGAIGRIVVTAGVASSNVVEIDLDDADYQIIQPLGGTPSSAPVGQPFVDVNGSPVPVTITSNDTQVEVGLEPGGYGFPSPVPSPAFASSVSLASTSALYTGEEDCGNLLFALSYAGGPTPSPSSPPTVGTVVIANGLSAQPPVFTGTANGAPLSTYAATYTYTVDPIWAYPTSATVTAGSSTTATITGYDPGLNPNDCCGSNEMFAAAVPATGVTPSQTSDCTDANGNVIANIAQGTYATNTGSQPFVITAGTLPSPGTVQDTCTFLLYDGPTRVITNPITVTVLPAS